jgi:hypothetical protein
MMYQHGQQLGRLTSRHKLILFAGVILPAVAISFEATMHICARIFFDPIPTSWHMLLVILVPLTQLQVWFAIRRADPNSLKLAGFANAAAIVITLFYSFIFLPLLPFAALTLLIALGLLPLSPFFALTTALIMRKQLRRVAATAPKRISRQPGCRYCRDRCCRITGYRHAPWSANGRLCFTSNKK